MIRELDTVVLARDLPEFGLEEGDVGAVVHLYDGAAAMEVEFVSGSGATVAVEILAATDVRALGAHEILHARERAA